MNNAPPLFQESPKNFTQPEVTDLPLVTAPKPSAKRLWFIAGGSIIFCMSMLFVWKILNPPPKPIIQVVPSSTPTPTPIRILSAVATQSAFLRLVDYQASLSAALSATNLDDPSLSPPIIELPLGFNP